MAKRPKCRDCKTKMRPLRWRALLDAWLCPLCEREAIPLATAALMAEIGII